MYKRIIVVSIILWCWCFSQANGQTDTMFIEYNLNQAVQIEAQELRNLTEINFGTGKVIYTLKNTAGGTFDIPTVNKIVFDNPVKIDAGQDQIVCSGPIVQLNGTVKGTEFFDWFVIQGSGIILNQTSTNAAYVVNVQDFETGLVKLVLRSRNSPGEDTIQLICARNTQPVANDDVTLCIEENQTVALSVGTPKGYKGIVTWKTLDKDGKFDNSNTTSNSNNPIYKPSTEEIKAGVSYVTVETEAQTTACPLGIDTVKITIKDCTPITYINFANRVATYGDPAIQLNATSAIPGTITYQLTKNSSCATLSPSGQLLITCVDTLEIQAKKEANGSYPADSSIAYVFIQKATPSLYVERRGAVIGAPLFQLKVTTNYDDKYYFRVIGDTNIVSIDNKGFINAKALGEVVVEVTVPENENFFSAVDYMTMKTWLTPQLPVAISDTIEFEIGQQVDRDVVQNDYGVTASLPFNSLYRVDLNPNEPGIQNRLSDYKNSIGTFIITTDGYLTFLPFVGFIGFDSIPYTIMDEAGLVSSTAYIYVRTKNIPSEEPLKANDALSPNNDGLNDALVIGYTNFNRSNSLVVFDQYGKTVFEKENYRNDWKGLDSGNDELPNGVYYYIFKEMNTDDSVRRSLKGYIQLIR